MGEQKGNQLKVMGCCYVPDLEFHFEKEPSFGM
jgi:hypothetical protein